MIDYYKLLNIDKGSTQDDIKAAYHLAARKWHPDSLAGEVSEQSEIEIRNLNEAWSILSDPIKRKEYDRSFQPHIYDLGNGLKVDSSYLSEDVLTKYTTEQETISNKKNIRFITRILIFGSIAAIISIFVFSSSQEPSDPKPELSVNIGQGIDLQDCIDIISGPALLKVSCGPNSDGVITEAFQTSMQSKCLDRSLRQVELRNDATVCLTPVKG